jgi:VIT1/CCC1 family predicted Fe2+/Mn2+ transporter
MPAPHKEIHRSHRAAWLRAAILGADDGIVSVSSLMLGLLATPHGNQVLIAGIAGLVAGALSMAAGEYVSVSSQRDSEMFDIAIEEKSLVDHPQAELQELAHIYEKRGLDPDLALTVAMKLHERGAVTAHARDELGIHSDELARPVQAALSSAVSFSAGAAVPILAALLVGNRVWVIASVSLVALAICGALGAYIGGGQRMRAAFRVFIGGGFAMAVTYIVGHVIGASL